jgi:hypothetical protein
MNPALSLAQSILRWLGCGSTSTGMAILVSAVVAILPPPGGIPVAIVMLMLVAILATQEQA